MLLNYLNMNYKYGFHVQKYDSMVKTVKSVTDYTPLLAMQVYISSPRMKTLPNFDLTDLYTTRKILEKHNYLYVVIHGKFTYNLAGTSQGPSQDNYNSILQSTIKCLTADLDFGVMLGNVGVIVHPGSRKNKEEGIVEIANTISSVLSRDGEKTEDIASTLNLSKDKVKKSRRIILENAAGEGTKICSTLEEISAIINKVPKKYRNQVKVCIDTAHAFGAGLYDWGLDGEIERFYDDFDNIIGLEKLEVFHLNDSKISEKKNMDAPYNSKKDRHENLGKGYIFDKSFEERFNNIKTFIYEAYNHEIPMIGEPPKDTTGFKDWKLISKLTEHDNYPLEYKVEL